MPRGKRKNKEQELIPQDPRPCPGVKLGQVLLDLRNSIHRAQRCRRTLKSLGFPQKEWLQIVMDIDPAMRFMVRAHMLDGIVVLLRKAGRPLSRGVLVGSLLEQGVGSRRQIQSSITANLRSGNLAQYPEDKIGMPEWRDPEHVSPKMPIQEVLPRNCPRKRSSCR